MNEQKNATFLDGVGGATASGATLSVNESTFGAPGRAVLSALSSPGGTVTVTLEAVSTVSNQLAEVYLHAGVSGGSITSVELVSGSTRTQIKKLKSGVGIPRRGLPGSMNFYYARIKHPTSGAANLVITAQVPNNTCLVIAKPFFNKAATPQRQCWQPGAHSNPDLNIPAWPSELPDFLPDSFEPASNPALKGFTSDDGVESTVRYTHKRRVAFRGILNLDMEQRDLLEQFYESTPGQFWFTRPDTQQVYFARWLSDGEPTDSGLAKTQRRTSIGLNLSLS